VLVDTEQNTEVDGYHQLTQRGRLPRPDTWQSLPMQVVSFFQPTNGRALAYQCVLGYQFLSQNGLVSFHYGRLQFYYLMPAQL
jgi:hypothetical protein